MVGLCECAKTVPSVLVQRQYWPNDPHRPTVAFSFKLLDLYKCLLLESHISLKAFVSTIVLKNRLSKDEVCVYTIQLVGLCNLKNVGLTLTKHRAWSEMFLLPALWCML